MTKGVKVEELRLGDRVVAAVSMTGGDTGIGIGSEGTVTRAYHWARGELPTVRWADGITTPVIDGQAAIVSRADDAEELIEWHDEALDAYVKALDELVAVRRRVAECIAVRARGAEGATEGATGRTDEVDATTIGLYVRSSERDDGPDPPWAVEVPRPTRYHRIISGGLRTVEPTELLRTVNRWVYDSLVSGGLSAWLRGGETVAPYTSLEDVDWDDPVLPRRMADGVFRIELNGREVWFVSEGVRRE